MNLSKASFLAEQQPWCSGFRYQNSDQESSVKGFKWGEGSSVSECLERMVTG